MPGAVATRRYWLLALCWPTSDPLKYSPTSSVSYSRSDRGLKHSDSEHDHLRLLWVGGQGFYSALTLIALYDEASYATDSDLISMVSACLLLVNAAGKNK
jgi:hypothetical protein